MSKFKVGIIEDDPMVAHINEEYTKRLNGFTVKKTKTLEDMKKQLNYKNFIKGLDIILLDIYLPGRNGDEILREIRKLDQDVYIIIITASEDTNIVNKCLNLGITDYLIKPFKFERFKKAFEKVINENRKIKQKERFTQEDIDQIIYHQDKDSSLENVSIEESLPKGLSETTLKKIMCYLKKNKGKKYISEEISEFLGFSRVTVQRYLNYLESQGVVKIKTEYGSVGRPKHYYIYDPTTKNPLNREFQT
ncbi:response regulator [Halarsenatibacter silvermanii]|uniref:Transcriptional regulatory protein n=1 Tax=Halarsenatibacter silvermanii TaxID=321763 RepID=A0A1G9TEF1_9FIRM|nr:response regulator [Halarsenatibacter silvermanii]SDM45948.1 two-component system, CitB family, response regulator MalR [Halarsenatibacter silvermanii]